jgi:hypothetical protein
MLNIRTNTYAPQLETIARMYGEVLFYFLRNIELSLNQMRPQIVFIGFFDLNFNKFADF